MGRVIETGPARVAIAIVVALLTACTTRRVPVPEASAGGTPDEVQALVRLALTLDAAGDRRADTLYAADAVVVGNARIRLAAPRFAGLSPGGNGRVTVTAATVSLEGRFAWVLVDYRWNSPAERRVEAGRATFICERLGGGWKIVHAHSSQPLPWEP